MDGFSDPITWSRNFDDEEFDEDYCEELPEVTFSLTDDGKRAAPNGKLKTKNLLIGVKTAASVLLHGCFASKTLLAEAKIDGIRTSVVDQRQHFLNHKTNNLYSIGEANSEANNASEALIFVSQVFSPASLFRLTKALYQLVDAEETFIFDTIPSSTYLAGVRYQTPTVRALQTSKAKDASSVTLTVPFLETPALIVDLTASILQHCQIHGLKATAYISLEDSLFLEVVTVEAWYPLLKSISSSLPVSETPAFDALLKKVTSRRLNSVFS